MEQGNEKQKQRAKWLIGVVTICILVFLGVQNLNVVIAGATWFANLIMPLLLGFAFALILNVPMCFFESHLWPKTNKPVLQKVRRPLSFVISFILIVGILTGVVLLVIPELIHAVQLIVQGTADLFNQLSKLEKSEILKLPFGNMVLGVDWNQIGNNLQTWLQNQSGNIMNTAVGTIGSVVGGVMNIFIAFVLSIYILFSKDKLKKQACRLIRAWLSPKLGEWLIHAADIAGKNFRNFVSGQTLEALIISTLCMIGMLILRLPYVPMVGALIGVTALIPVVGGFIGAVIGAFMILTVDPIKAIIFLVFIIILQQLEGNLIYPKVMGKRIKLPAIWILVAVTVGGGLGGPIGMLLGVPVASASYVLIREATEQREKKRQETLENPFDVTVK